MKKFLWGLGIMVIAMVIAGLIYRDRLILMAFSAYVKPSSSFADSVAPAPPDYASTDNWAALPDNEDGADFTPVDVNDGQSSADVDVFFIHPTTYINSEGWNAPMGDVPSGNWVDSAVMTGQASVFNGATRVFAPRYRQAQIYAFMALEEGGNDALELAYTDIESAFDHYLEEYNVGRPFILAGHSQGALHTRRLLERKISGTPLLQRMVAAYPVGYPMSSVKLAESIPDIPVCQTANQTACLVTWNTIGDGYRPYQPIKDMVCVNPLTWTNDGVQGDFEDNQGVLSKKSEALMPAVADARCEDGWLYVSEIRTDVYDDLPDMGKGNHHLLDFSLYWANIRENVYERVTAFSEADASH